MIFWSRRISTHSHWCNVRSSLSFTLVVALPDNRYPLLYATLVSETFTGSRGTVSIVVNERARVLRIEIRARRGQKRVNQNQEPDSPSISACNADIRRTHMRLRIPEPEAFNSNYLWPCHAARRGALKLKAEGSLRCFRNSRRLKVEHKYLPFCFTHQDVLSLASLAFVQTATIQADGD